MTHPLNDHAEHANTTPRASSPVLSVQAIPPDSTSARTHMRLAHDTADVPSNCLLLIDRRRVHPAGRAHLVRPRCNTRSLRRPGRPTPLVLPMIQEKWSVSLASPATP